MKINRQKTNNEDKQTIKEIPIINRVKRFHSKVKSSNKNFVPLLN
jgi:hypothetical protein